MKLKVEWVKSSQPHIVKTQVETTFRDSLLDKFNGVENAKKACDYYKKFPNDLFQEWTWAYYEAHTKVKGMMSANDYARTGFRVTFEGCENV